MRHDVAHSESAMANVEPIVRSLQKPEAPGLRRRFLNSTKPVQVYSNGGIYLGKGMSYEVDKRRILNTISKTTRGLYFHEYQSPLSHDYEVYSLFEEDIKMWPEAQLEHFGKKFFQPVLAEPERRLGTVLRYWCQRAVDDPNFSVWIFEFFGSVLFLAMSAPRGHLESMQ